MGFNALKVTPEPVRVATEGALWGSVQAHEFLCDAVVLSDDAGQFNIGRHALCWIHAERLVHKLEAFTHQHRAAQTRVRGIIWDFYADLKAYQLKPGKRRASALRTRFDRIFLRRTGFATLDRLLARLHANKAELLMVLDCSLKSRSTPTVPKMTFAVRSHGARSAREHGATSGGTAA